MVSTENKPPADRLPIGQPSPSAAAESSAKQPGGQRVLGRVQAIKEQVQVEPSIASAVPVAYSVATVGEVAADSIKIPSRNLEPARLFERAPETENAVVERGPFSWGSTILKLAAAFVVLGGVVSYIAWDSLDKSSALPEPAATVAKAVIAPEPTSAPLPIAGRVEDSVTGLPISGAKLFYAGEQRSTASSGGFKFTRRPEQNRLLVRAAGYQPQSLDTGPDEAVVRLEPFEARAIHIGQAYAVSSGRSMRFRDLVSKTPVNAVVYGVKSPRGYLSLKVDHPFAKEIGALGRLPEQDLAQEVKNWKQEGIHMIAHVAVLRDDLLARAKPGFALRSLKSKREVRDASGLGWTDPSVSDVHGYNIAVAQAAAAAGFDEVQFDFVWYPVTPLGSEGVDAAEKMRRLESATQFLREAVDALAPYNVPIGVNVLGSICTMREVSRVGQKLEEFAAIVDYVSPMLYPSAFASGSGMNDPLEHSYELVHKNLQEASKLLAGNSRKLRPWLQNFPDHRSPKTPLTTETIHDQIRAALAADTGGWTLTDQTARYQNTLEALQLLSAAGPGKTPKPVTQAAVQLGR